jgi:hypothetical protein
VRVSTDLKNRLHQTLIILNAEVAEEEKDAEEEKGAEEYE